MGYFLGKESLVMPSGETAAPAAEQSNIATAATGPPPGTEKDRADACKAQCKDYVPGSREYGTCMDRCMNPGGRGGPGGKAGCVEGKPCKADSDCPGGECVGVVVDQATKRITPGKCNCGGGGGGGEPDPSACPEGSGGTALEGCPCGTIYNTKTGKCATGYRFVKRNNNGLRDDWAKEIAPIPGAIGTCECEKWITPPGPDKGLGEYEYPQGMQELMTLLMNRGKGFNGLDPAAIEAMFGKGFGNIRMAEAGSRDQLNRRLSSQGMLGTGTAVEAGKDLGWKTEGGIIDLARDIMIKNEEMKRSDTELLSSILGRGMGFEQLLEAINAGRRGEGQNALAMILSLLNLFKG